MIHTDGMRTIANRPPHADIIAAAEDSADRAAAVERMRRADARRRHSFARDWQGLVPADHIGRVGDIDYGGR